MYLKNITCPDCGIQGMVLKERNFYCCDECGYSWETVSMEQEKETLELATTPGANISKCPVCDSTSIWYSANSKVAKCDACGMFWNRHCNEGD